MLIDVITQNTAEKLIELISQSQKNNHLVGALFIKFSAFDLHPSETEVVSLIRPAVSEKQASLYLYPDGDVIITWRGAQKAVLDSLLSLMKGSYPVLQGEFYQYYDIQAHGEDLRAAARQKMIGAALAPAPKTDAKKTEGARSHNGLALSEKHILEFRRAQGGRKARIHPEILIVEDQMFSRKLLITTIGDKYKTYEAADAETALQVYLRNAPDIVFLDIELPGMSGHQFAAVIQRLDVDAYVVMVTGNSHLDDIERARANATRGYIVKPFTREKIFDQIQKFLNENRK